LATSLAYAALCAGVARAHLDPPECTSSGVSLIVTALRADGKTGLSGSASECERIVYRATLRVVGPTTCAVSGGTLSLTTPDGIVHTLADPVPCLGGQAAERLPDGTDGVKCEPGTSAYPGQVVPYDVRSSDAVDGVLGATARFRDGVIHDSVVNTKGIGAEALRQVALMRCDDADPCTEDRCDPVQPAAAACSNVPRCDDADPTTVDTCSAGRCTFTPVASSVRIVCGP
jgi:hypothetical protein